MGAPHRVQLPVCKEPECTSSEKVESVWLPNGKRGMRCKSCRDKLVKMRLNTGLGVFKPRWKETRS